MKVIRSLISKYRYLKSCYHRIWRAPNDFNVPLLTRIKYARHLFTANEYHWFNFEENYYGDYISDFERIKSRDINGEYKLILDDKLLFEEVFKHYIKVPQNYAWVSSGVVYGRNGYDITNDNIMQFLIEKRKQF